MSESIQKYSTGIIAILTEFSQRGFFPQIFCFTPKRTFIFVLFTNLDEVLTPKILDLDVRSESNKSQVANILKLEYT